MMWKVDQSKIITADQKSENDRISLEAQFSRAIQCHLDDKARERQYDGIQAAITYRDDPNPNFAAEAKALFEWRSLVWTFSTEQLVLVKNGSRTLPSISELISELPPFEWPITLEGN